MRIFAILAVAALLGSGFFIGLRAFLDYPSRKSRKAIQKSSQPLEKKKLLEQLEPFFLKIATPFAKLIPLNPYREKEMSILLDNGALPYTPRVFIARSISIAFCVCLLSIPFFFVFPLGGFGILGMGVLVGLQQQAKIYDISKNRKKNIEAELPRFTQHVALAVQKTSNVTGMLEVYRPMAGKTFGKELEKTIADMKTSDVQGALTRFAQRINSSMLSEVTRGLRSVDQGIDQGTHFQLLAFTYRDRQNQLLKKEALKKPDKISSFGLLGLAAMLVQIGVVFGTLLLDNWSIFKM